MIRSLCLSYPILGLRVSPRSQQQLHSCGVTTVRCYHERSEAIPLYIEGEGGTHTIVAKREEGKNRSLCLSYLIHGVLVSPRSQQQLHSCGVAIVRGPHKSSEAIPLYIEGEGGTHTIVAKREEWRT